MLNIIIGILSFNLILVLFKLLDKYKVNNLQALFFNYLIAGIGSAILIRESLSFETLFTSDFSAFGFIIGGLFIGSFLFLALASQIIGMGIATIANKMSVVLPVIFAIILLNEVLSWQKILGVTLALIAVIFVTNFSGQQKLSAKDLLILGVIFIGQGVADIFFNLSQSWYVGPNEKILFFTCIFFSAAAIGLIAILYQIIIKKVNFQAKSILWGAVLGLLNFCTLYFFFATLESGILESSKIYPIFNMAIILIAALVGFLFFKEKLSIKNWIGIGIAILSIFLLGFDFKP